MDLLSVFNIILIYGDALQKLLNKGVSEVIITFHWEFLTVLPMKLLPKRMISNCCCLMNNKNHYLVNYIKDPLILNPKKTQIDNDGVT